MRLLLTLLLIAGFCTCVRAQIGASVDAEYASWCMVDSLPGGQVVRFTRLVNIATLRVVDINPVSGLRYTSTGTLLTCEAYDLAQTTRDLKETVYEDCQCTYTIAQEGHQVTQILGGSQQEFIVSFDEFVVRKCDGQMTGDEVYRKARMKTLGVPNNYKQTLSIGFNTPGQYMDSIAVRAYTSSTTSMIVNVDLNPSTVQISYPPLSLEIDDFTYSGANEAAMAAAYQVVIRHALSQALGGAPISNEVVATSSSSGAIFLAFRLLHDPIFPYLLHPYQGDPDYVAPAGLNAGYVENVGGGNSSTETNVYTIEGCGDIYTQEQEKYLTWSQSAPLVLSPEPGIQSSIIPPLSVPTMTCDAPPALCVAMEDEEVMIGDCVETCSDVQNLAGHVGLANVDTTLTAATYNSISIYVTTGPVGVVLDGQRINYPAGWSTLWSAAPGKLLQNSIRIDAIGAEAIISYVR